VGFRIDGTMPDGGARGVLPEKIVSSPIVRWPDRPRHKSATAVRADIFKLVDARSTKRAFVRADSRFQRLGRKRPVAVLTGWSEFKHLVDLILLPNDTRPRKPEA
jgi:hypothetical protein